MANSHKEMRKLLVSYLDTFERSAPGALVLEHLKTETLQGPSYVRGDPHQTAYNEGRRSMVMDIIHNVAQGARVARGKQIGTDNATVESESTDAITDDAGNDADNSD